MRRADAPRSPQSSSEDLTPLVREGVKEKKEPSIHWAYKISSAMTAAVFVALFLDLNPSIAPVNKKGQKASTCPSGKEILESVSNVSQRNSTLFCDVQAKSALKKLFPKKPQNEKICSCHIPMEPHGHDRTFVNDRKWNAALAINKRNTKESATRSPEIVFLGDSITEFWTGYILGEQKFHRLKDTAAIFKRYFTRAGGGKLDGVALGISADRISQLLYRITEAQVMGDLQPRVIWLLIGVNDLLYEACDTDTISAGIIHVAETLRTMRPNATVVVNSILPMPKGSYLGDFVERINEKLLCYVRRSEGGGLDFMNNTEVFIPDATAETVKHLPDHIHPDSEGYEVWAKAISARVTSIIQN